MVDFGLSCINGSTFGANTYIHVEAQNPALATGNVAEIEIQAASNMTTVDDVAAFSAAAPDQSTNLTSVGMAAIGKACNQGCCTFKSTDADFIEFEIQIDEYIGVGFTDGTIDIDGNGTAWWHRNGGAIPTEGPADAYVFNNSNEISLGGTLAVGGAGDTRGGAGRGVLHINSGAISKLWPLALAWAGIKRTCDKTPIDRREFFVGKKNG